MKTTKYFNYTRLRSDRACIKYEWITFVIKSPIKEVVQSDGRIKKWAKISDVNKYLRVIVLEDGETVHNTFFDRTFQEKNSES